MGAFPELSEMMVPQALPEDRPHLVCGFTLDPEQAGLEAQQLEEEQMVQHQQDHYFLARLAALARQHLLLVATESMVLRLVVVVRGVA